jgi:hypothetical protein
VIRGWLQAVNTRGIRAEVFDLPPTSSLRIVRFVLAEDAFSQLIDIKPEHDLTTLLQEIGRRLKTPVGSSLIGARELRVHGSNEVVIIKPAARRYWLTVNALDDADAVVAESFTGSRQ